MDNRDSIGGEGELDPEELFQAYESQKNVIQQLQVNIHTKKSIGSPKIRNDYGAVLNYIFSKQYFLKETIYRYINLQDNAML